MNTPVILKPLEKNDYPGLNDLFAHVFRCDRTLDAWSWKYDANPHGKAVATVAVAAEPDDTRKQAETAVKREGGIGNTTDGMTCEPDDLTPVDSRILQKKESSQGKIVGLYGLIPRALDFMGRTMCGWQEVDLMVDPEYASGGLFKRLGRESYARLIDNNEPFTFGFPNQTSLPAGKRILGWKAIEKIPLWTMLLRPADALSEKIPAVPGIRSLVNAVFRMHMSMKLHTGWSGRVGEDTQVTEKLAGFLQVPAGETGITFIRDPDYLRWRYEQSPEQRYTCFTAESGGRMEAAAILGIPDSERANLAEFHLSEGGEGAAAALLRYIAGYCAERGCATLRAWALQNSPEAYFFRKSGFFDRNARNYHVIRSFRPPEFNRYLWDARRWRLTSGDSDCV